MRENGDKGGLRIGVLPGIASLYDRAWPEMRGMVHESVKKTCQILEQKKSGISLSLKEPVSSADGFRRACKDFEREKVDLLLIVLPPYCPSGVFWPAITETELPVLIWPQQTMLRLDPETYGRKEIWLNHGVHAAQDLANVFRRNAVPFGILHGHIEQKETVGEIVEWARAGAAVQAMRKASPVQLGGHFEDMLDLQIGDAPFLRELGVECVKISLDRFVAQTKEVSETTMANRCDLYRDVFEIAPGVADELLKKTARGDAALQKIVESLNSTAIGLNFLSLCNDERIADALHVSASLLMLNGCGYGGEGDWITGLLVRGLQKAVGAASFSEIFSVGYADNRLVLKHWGEGNPKMARTRPALVLSELHDRVKAEFLIVDFEFSPGQVTLVNLNETPEGRGQLISVTGEITEDSLPRTNGPRAVFKPDAEDVRDLLTSYARNGGSHHLALVAERQTKLVAKIARLLNWEHVIL